ncbi:MAG: methyltransferase domain-containing protein [Bacteroidetes bacterium]|nr:methyltransferase domain-containing protein [Bacteroidota bacterium]
MQQQAFDTYAPAYDEHFTDSLIGRAQRSQVYHHLSKQLQLNNKSLLEVNCGTGEDALWLFEQGANVMATDISTEMLNVAKTKSGNSSVKFKQLDAQNIGTLIPDTYDIIFSNFGGLNCLNNKELENFKKGCSLLQPTHSYLVFVIMGTQCWWERLYFKWKREAKTSIRRLNKAGIETSINGYSFKTYYYHPNDFKELFKDHYICKLVRPIGLCVPPSYLEPYFKNRRRALSILKFLDSLFGRFSFLSNYADHYIIVFEKK